MSQWAEIRHLHLVERVPKKEIARRLKPEFRACAWYSTSASVTLGGRKQCGPPLRRSHWPRLPFRARHLRLGQSCE